MKNAVDGFADGRRLKAEVALAGKITFWEEIDRQHLLVKGSKKDIKEAVEKVRHMLWRNGGCIAQ